MGQLWSVGKLGVAMAQLLSLDNQSYRYLFLLSFVVVVVVEAVTNGGNAQQVYQPERWGRREKREK